MIIMAHATKDFESTIPGDILESIFTHMPLINLVTASQVCKSWNLAVTSSLLHFNPIKPWLLVYTQSNSSSYLTAAHAYDPRSHLWLRIHHPFTEHVSALRSSHSTLLYMLTPTLFTFSFDPLHLTWHSAEPPILWRKDPIVAMVGDCVVVAGGACDFEEDPLALEIYNIKTRKWDTCDSMPSILKDSLSSTWLSVAVDDRKMHVMVRNTGVTYGFDPYTKIWYGPYELCPDQSVFSCVIGSLRGRLMVAGLVGDPEHVESIRLWEVKGGVELERRELVVMEMPKDMVKKLKGESGFVSSIEMDTARDFVHIYNRLEPSEVIVCKVRVNGNCEWGAVKNMVCNESTRMQRQVVTCSDVDVEYLQRALRSENVTLMETHNMDGLSKCNEFH